MKTHFKHYRDAVQTAFLWLFPKVFLHYCQLHCQWSGDNSVSKALQAYRPLSVAETFRINHFTMVFKGQHKE